MSRAGPGLDGGGDPTPHAGSSDELAGEPAVIPEGGSAVVGEVPNGIQMVGTGEPGSDGVTTSLRPGKVMSDVR